MSRFISAVMAIVLIMVAILIGFLSCSPVNIAGTLASFITGLPTSSLCYSLFPSIVGTIAGIVFTVLGAVAVLATVLG
jgi:hypothetical protein